MTKPTQEKKEDIFATHILAPFHKAHDNIITNCRKTFDIQERTNSFNVKSVCAVIEGVTNQAYKDSLYTLPEVQENLLAVLKKSKPSDIEAMAIFISNIGTILKQMCVDTKYLGVSNVEKHDEHGAFNRKAVDDIMRRGAGEAKNEAVQSLSGYIDSIGATGEVKTKNSPTPKSSR